MRRAGEKDGPGKPGETAGIGLFVVNRVLAGRLWAVWRIIGAETQPALRVAQYFERA